MKFCADVGGVCCCQEGIDFGRSGASEQTGSVAAAFLRAAMPGSGSHRSPARAGRRS